MIILSISSQRPKQSDAKTGTEYNEEISKTDQPTRRVRKLAVKKSSINEMMVRL